mmetsp:Transcript_18848/g.42202  ORF Transcript_18848/g.42202 Transcript_18848/m.42202 type:complete len:129 (+) Transcript_18848:438-824(+)
MVGAEWLVMCRTSAHFLAEHTAIVLLVHVHARLASLGHLVVIESAHMIVTDMAIATRAHAIASADGLEIFVRCRCREGKAASLASRLVEMVAIVFKAIAPACKATAAKIVRWQHLSWRLQTAVSGHQE